MAGQGERWPGAASSASAPVGDAAPPFELHAIGWEWFALLARQRIQLVSFWFVAMSFLTAAGMTAYTADRVVAAMGISTAMAGASVVFFLLDRRTRGQLALARGLLEDVERRIASRYHLASAEIAVNLHRRQAWDVSYRHLFGWLYGGAGALSLAALLGMWWSVL